MTRERVPRYTRDQTVPLDVEYDLSADEIRRFLAYGRMPPLMAPGERWRWPDTFNKLYERLRTAPSVCLFDFKSHHTASLKAWWVRQHLDRTLYVVHREAGTQVWVYNRAYWEMLTAAHVDNWMRTWSPYEYARLDQCAIRLGLTPKKARELMAKHGVERHTIDYIGHMVYRKADVEAIAEDREARGVAWDRMKVPWGWYDKRPRPSALRDSIYQHPSARQNIITPLEKDA